jgi:hypothetical protein
VGRLRGGSQVPSVAVTTSTPRDCRPIPRVPGLRALLDTAPDRWGEIDASRATRLRSMLIATTLPGLLR